MIVIITLYSPFISQYYYRLTFKMPPNQNMHRILECRLKNGNKKMFRSVQMYLIDAEMQ